MIHPKALIGVLLISVLALSGCGGDNHSGAVAAPTDAKTDQVPGQLQPLVAGKDVLAPDGRYSMRVPADWIEYEDPIAELGFRTLDTSAPRSLNIVREDLQGMDRTQAYAERARQRVASIYQNVVTLSLAPVRVGDRDAYRWVYTATAGGTERLFYQLYIIDGDQGFVLTGMSPAGSSIEDSQFLFDAIAGSLSFARG